MRNLKLFNLVVVIGAMLFTLNSLAASPVKVHVMDNLNSSESTIVTRELKKLGYAPSAKAIFSEAKDAVIITKTLANEVEKEGLTIEIMHLESANAIPQKVFEYRMDSADVASMMGAFPKADQLRPMNPTPVALQMQE